MRRFALCLLCAVSFAFSGSAQLFGPRKSPPPYPQQAPGTPMRKPAQLISRQPPMKVNQSVLNQCTAENARIVVSIPKQRAYLMVGEQIAIDAPVSSGKRGHETPTGNF